MQQEKVKRPTAALGLMLVGGVLSAVGAFLSWARVASGQFGVSTKGIDGSDGWIALACGAVLVLVGLGVWMVTSRGARVGLGILAVVLGLASGGIATWDAVTAEDSLIDAVSKELSDQYQIPVAEVETQVRQAMDAGDLSITLQAGIFLVIAGGALGLLGGIAGMASRVPVSAAAMPDAVPPAPGAGWAAPPAPATLVKPAVEPPGEETPLAEG